MRGSFATAIRNERPATVISAQARNDARKETGPRKTPALRRKMAVADTCLPQMKQDKTRIRQSGNRFQTEGGALTRGFAPEDEALTRRCQTGDGALPHHSKRNWTGERPNVKWAPAKRRGRSVGLLGQPSLSMMATKTMMMTMMSSALSILIQGRKLHRRFGNSPSSARHSSFEMPADSTCAAQVCKGIVVPNRLSYFVLKGSRLRTASCF